jgi:hypothetical protein
MPAATNAKILINTAINRSTLYFRTTVGGVDGALAPQVGPEFIITWGGSKDCWGPGGGTAGLSVVPQLPQNFAVEGSSALQTGHFIFTAPF